MPNDLDRMGRTALGALRAHGYPPAAIANMLGLLEVDLESDRLPAGSDSALICLAEQLAARPGPCRSTAAQAKKEGFRPPAAYDHNWTLVDTDDDPSTVARDDAVLRWEIAEALAAGMPTDKVSRMFGVCTRTVERRRKEMGLPKWQPSKYERELTPPRDQTWLELARRVLATAAGDSIIDEALQHGLMGEVDLPAKHPIRRRLSAERADVRRARYRAARHAAAVGQQLSLV